MNDDRRATRWRSPDEPCLNCGDATPGRYCPACGQRKTEVLVSVRTMLADVLEDQLVLNRALPRTLSALLFRPGRLTNEYVRGRIVRYIAPFRLYLVSSVLFFLIVSFVGFQGLRAGAAGAGDSDPGMAPADSLAAVDTALGVLENIDTTGMPIEARDVLREQVGEQVERAAESRAAAAQGGADSASADEPASADTAFMPGTLQPWAREMRSSTPWTMLNRAAQRKVAQVGHLPPREALREVLRDLLEYAPHMVFLLLPLFAFLLKLLYIRRDRYYAEHFVFALHVHAFVFVMFTVMFIIPWNQLDGLLMLWIVVYIWLALHRVYRQGWIRTTIKWWTLGWMYFWLLLFGLIGLAIATLLLT